jgi:hypothetical protein
MNPIDKEAYELAITIASRNPVERRRIEAASPRARLSGRSAETACIHASAIRAVSCLGSFRRATQATVRC